MSDLHSSFKVYGPKSPRSIYLIGSLRNPRIVEIGNKLRQAGWEAFDDWTAAGPHADDAWKAYEVARGRSYKEALAAYPARHVFTFDKRHLDRCNSALLVLPAGKSAHLELGYVLGCGKSGYVLLSEHEQVDRWDVMYQFATEVFVSEDEMLQALAPEPYAR